MFGIVTVNKKDKQTKKMPQLGNKYYTRKNAGNSGLSLEYFKWALFSDVDPFLFHVQHEKLS